MLEDANFAEIVSWGYTGDSFVVKVRLLTTFATHQLTPDS